MAGRQGEMMARGLAGGVEAERELLRLAVRDPKVATLALELTREHEWTTPGAYRELRSALVGALPAQPELTDPLPTVENNPSQVRLLIGHMLAYNLFHELRAVLNIVDHPEFTDMVVDGFMALLLERIDGSDAA